ncbi:hypothetical protein FHR92_000717 [Fontibacillus solani]|uniref:Uncharacterized protein n=2 Tax=Fontibacillus solani TaxID=1572857 RepID=A0A7W3SQL2_9BACL|nr:hypothetical protein [Fontibacillus solani]
MDKGWAHSMAHIADVIDELGSSTLLSAIGVPVKRIIDIKWI